MIITYYRNEDLESSSEEIIIEKKDNTMILSKYVYIPHTDHKRHVVTMTIVLDNNFSNITLRDIIDLIKEY